MESEEALQKYADTIMPCVYDDFVAEAVSVLSREQKNNLRKLLNFKFKRHSRYNLSKDRLTMIERIIRNRAKEILDKG